MWLSKLHYTWEAQLHQNLWLRWTLEKPGNSLISGLERQKNPPLKKNQSTFFKCQKEIISGLRWFRESCHMDAPVGKKEIVLYTPVTIQSWYTIVTSSYVTVRQPYFCFQSPNLALLSPYTALDLVDTVFLHGTTTEQTFVGLRYGGCMLSSDVLHFMQLAD